MTSISRLRADAADCTRCDRDRGTVLPAGEEVPYATLVTVHPSAVLRTRPPDRDVAFDALVLDLRVAAEHVVR